MGLIKCGSVVIPFDNQISKDTDLYRRTCGWILRYAYRTL